jgi:hypothetical protein
MNPALIVAIPVALMILGLVLNSFPLGLDQPASPAEQDPMKRLEAEKQGYRKVFDLQRSRSLSRQKNVGRYCWLVLLATVGSFIWMYLDTVGKTTVRNQIAALQTLGTEGGKDMVLSVTTSEGTNVKYLIKLPTAAEAVPADPKNLVVAEKVSNWELEKIGIAQSTGDKSLPLGIALKMAN